MKKEFSLTRNLIDLIRLLNFNIKNYEEQKIFLNKLGLYQPHQKFLDKS